MIERIVNVLRRMDERRHLHESRCGASTIPLVAVPVVGIGRGGYAHNRGEVLRALVERLSVEARELCVDVALVAPEPAVYTAAQYARRKLVPRLPDALEASAEELGAAARGGSLALVLGAGVSAAAGLPSWTQLIETLARDLRVTEVDFSDKKFTPTDQAELIEQYAKEDFQQRVANIVGKRSAASLLHGLLAGLDAREVITTNYDVSTSAPWRPPGAASPASSRGPPAATRTAGSSSCTATSRTRRRSSSRGATWCGTTLPSARPARSCSRCC
ncbi:hypothetical protein ACOACO_02810 [Nocardioides sp. CPCC 205120]|uniref:hypothetical protein n=1 Tax=Nocardioides sp. CPCC 205120 TaxID=3406462 RepID=UPI003B5013F2